MEKDLMAASYGQQTLTALQFTSLEDYLAYDDGTDACYELVDGVLVEMGNESKLNIQIAMFLAFHFGTLGLPHYLISLKTELVVPSRKVTARYPDLVILTDELEALLKDEYRYIIKPEMPAPALVVEVVSPGQPGEENYDRDYVTKRREYAERGIPEYWIIDPQRQVVWVLVLQGLIYQEQQFTGTQKIVSPAFADVNLTADQVLRAGK
jgi:Uma2 family endonuclease